MSDVLLLKRDGNQEDGSVGQKYLLQNWWHAFNTQTHVEGHLSIIQFSWL